MTELLQEPDETLAEPGPIELPTQGEVILRQAQLEDAQRLFELLKANKDRLRKAHMHVPRNLEEAQRRIVSHNSKGYLDFGIWAGDELIGEVGLGRDKPDSEDAEIFYWLDRNHVGKGYAADAARSLAEYALGPLGINILTAKVDTNNAHSESSKRTLRRAGFQPLTHESARVHVFTRRADLARHQPPHSLNS